MAAGIEIGVLRRLSDHVLRQLGIQRQHVKVMHLVHPLRRHQGLESSHGSIRPIVWLR